MEDKTMARIKVLSFLLALVAQVPLASATVTYVVGACLPKLTTFATIQSALNASPSPNVIEVCPGTYPEQIVIDIPVTIEGISADNATGATITVPPGGLQDSFANLAVQVLVQANGEVNLSNLTVDATGNGDPIPFWIVGVLYYGAFGTMNHMTIQNQNGDGDGVGAWIWSSSPGTVTVENSNVQNFDRAGILVESFSTSADLTATIKGNYLASGFADSTGITLAVETSPGSGLLAPFVSGNLITGTSTGIALFGGQQGSISKNTVVSVAGVGIADGSAGVADEASVTSNTIFNAPTSGVQIASSTGPVTGNTITAAGNGIDFTCTAGNNVHSNTILGATNGLINLPSGTLSANTYYGVGTISSGGC
jgi:hypothetical protein